MSELQESQTHSVFHHTEDLFIIHSDRNCSSLGICCCTPEVLHTIPDLLPHCCVTRLHSVLFSSNDTQMLQKAHSYALQPISHKFLECFLCCSFQSFTDFFTVLNDLVARWVEGATEQKAVLKRKNFSQDLKVDRLVVLRVCND